MKLRQLTYFRAVVEHRSLAAAADVLRVAQPNLSVAIRQLEEEWGVTLFDRAGRGLLVTDTGRELYERATELLGGASALEQQMRAIGRGFTARLRIGFTQISVEAVAASVAAMREDGSAVNFSLQQGEPQLLEAMVEARQLDLAITHMPVANPALAVEVVAPMTVVLLCREGDDRWAGTGEVTPARLAEVPLILLRRRSGSGIYERIVSAFTAVGVACPVVVESTDVAAIYPLVARGVGLGLLPVHPLQVPQPGFAMYPVSLISPPERLALIYPRGRRLLPAVHRAMELCRMHLRVH